MRGDWKDAECLPCVAVPENQTRQRPTDHRPGAALAHRPLDRASTHRLRPPTRGSSGSRPLAISGRITRAASSWSPNSRGRNTSTAISENNSNSFRRCAFWWMRSIRGARAGVKKNLRTEMTSEMSNSSGPRAWKTTPRGDSEKTTNQKVFTNLKINQRHSTPVVVCDWVSATPINLALNELTTSSGPRR